MQRAGCPARSIQPPWTDRPTGPCPGHTACQLPGQRPVWAACPLDPAAVFVPHRCVPLAATASKRRPPVHHHRYELFTTATLTPPLGIVFLAALQSSDRRQLLTTARRPLAVDNYSKPASLARLASVFKPPCQFTAVVTIAIDARTGYNSTMPAASDAPASDNIRHWALVLILEPTSVRTTCIPSPMRI